MKKSNNKKIQQNQKLEIKETRKNHVYGIIGMVVLFLMGVIFGFIINGSDHVNKSTMSKSDCRDIANQIISAAQNNRPALIEQLNKVYSENCLDRIFEQPKPQPKVEEKKLPETTCEAIEELLKHNLYNEDNPDWEAHENNAKVYDKLATNGCEKNREKYSQLSQRENDIANALKNQDNVVTGDMPTCKQIERVLIPELQCVGGYEICGYPDVHIRNAKIYANLSERGCAENSQKYKELAKQELEIARALNDDNLRREEESIEIVETYKRLQMRAEAEKMIEKAKKLTNPAIDFIIQLEKIIEE